MSIQSTNTLDLAAAALVLAAAARLTGPGGAGAGLGIGRWTRDRERGVRQLGAVYNAAVRAAAAVAGAAVAQRHAWRSGEGGGGHAGGPRACLYWSRVREIEKGKREPRRGPLLGPAAPCAMACLCRAVICGAAELGHVAGRCHGGSLAAPPCMAR